MAAAGTMVNGAMEQLQNLNTGTLTLVSTAVLLSFVIAYKKIMEKKYVRIDVVSFMSKLIESCKIFKIKVVHKYVY